MKSPQKKVWPWLIMILVPIWLIGVVSDLRQAWQLESAGLVIPGRMESPGWVTGPKNSKVLAFEAVWGHEGSEYRRSFTVPYDVGVAFVDPAGQQIEERLEIRFVPSNPVNASVTIHPPDPFWVSIILALFGLCVISGTIFFLVRGRVVRP
jgi:hypothetical protein